MREDGTRLIEEGKAATARGEYESALVFFRLAREIDEKSREALGGIAELSSELGDEDAAIAAFLDLAELHICSGHLVRASWALTRVLALAPDNELANRLASFVNGRIELDPMLVKEADMPVADSLFEAAPTTMLANGTLDEKLDAETAEPTKPRFPRATDRKITFSDITTRPASQAMVLAFRRRSVGEIFGEPTKAASRDILAELKARCADPEAVVAEMEQLSGESLEQMSEWDAAASSAAATAHIPYEDVLEACDDEAEAEFLAPSNTIELGGLDVAKTFAELCRTSPILRTIGPNEQAALLTGCEVIQTFAGQHLSAHADRGASLFILLSGDAELTDATENKENNGGHVTSISPGEFFGEDAVLGGIAQRPIAHVTSDSLWLEIGSQQIKALVRRQPRVMRLIAQVLRRRFLDTLFHQCARLGDLSHKQQRQLRGRAQLFRAKPGGIIMGNNPEGLWFLMSGTASRSGPSWSEKVTPTAVLGIGRSSDAIEIVAESTCWLLRLSLEDARILRACYKATDAHS